MSAFAPTHAAPPGGLPARTAPHPDAPVVATVSAGVEMAVAERRGAWARVSCSNGWTGWVDGRRLAEAAPRDYRALFEAAQGRPAPGGAATAAAGPARPWTERLRTPLAGAVAVGVGALLPWIRGGGASGNALDVPLRFVVDVKSAGRAGVLNLGLVLLAVAVAGAVLAGLPRRAAQTRLCGAAAVLLGTVFVAQVQRLLSTPAAGGRTGLFSTLGLGVVVTVAGGLLLALSKEKSS